MLTYIEEFKKHLAIAGFKDRKTGNVEGFLQAVRREKPSDAEVQFFDAKLVATWEHLYFAAFNALSTFENNKSISNTISMEAMLFASAQNQIRRAMTLLGMKSGSSNIAVLIVATESESIELTLSIVSKYIEGKRDDGILELSTQKSALIQEVFQISDTELQTIIRRGDSNRALVDLVIERMALLAARK